MKKVLVLLSAVVLLQAQAFSQSDKYVSAMKKNLALFDSARTAEDYNRMANTFERIGDAEKDQWLPYYYGGLALALGGWLETVKDKDANATRINAFCDKAESLTQSNTDKAEILSLRNMSATQQMLVDPPGRYMSYGIASGQALEKGLQLDPENPRLHYLKGMGLFGTPEQFGGGKEKAKPEFEKAVELFKKAKPKELYPTWGKQQAEEMLAQCQ